MMRKKIFLFLLLACAADTRPQTQAVSQTPVPRPELYVQGGFDSKIGSLVFSADGKHLACLANNGSVFLWEVGRGAELRRFESGVEGANTLALSDDAKFLAVGGVESIEVWDVAKAEVTNKLAARGGPILSLAFSAGGRLLAGGDGSGAITLWSPSSGNVVASTQWPDVKISAVAFSPDGRSLAAGSTGLVRLYDVQAQKVSKTYKLADAEFDALVYSSDSKLFALDLGGNTVWDVEREKKSPPLLWFEAAGSTAALDMGGELLALSHPDTGFVALLDWKRQRCIRSFGATANNITALAFTADGRKIFAGDQDADIKYIDLMRGRVLQSVAALLQPGNRAMSRTWGGTYTLVLSPDGRYLFSAAGLKNIKLWDVEASKELGALGWYALCENCLAFSADGKLFAATHTNGVYPPRITIFDLPDVNSLAQYDGHQDNVNSLAFSRDGSLLASGSSDNTVRIWDLKRGEEARTLEHPTPVWSVAFSADGRLLASGGEDGTVRFWDAASDAELRVVKGHGDRVVALEFGPDGRQLASLGGGEIKLWNVADGAAVKYERMPAWVAVNQRFGIINLNGKLLRPVVEGKVIKLTDPDTKEELASLLSLGDKDWMVTTPDGSFDASSVYSPLGAWKHLLWRFNGNTFDYAPVEAFFGEFYRPGLLEEFVWNRRPKVSRELPVLDRRQPRVNISLVTPPPTRDRTPPVERSRQIIDCTDVPYLRDFALSSPVQRVEVEVTETLGGNSASGVRDVRLFRNDSLVKIWHGQTAEEVASQPGCRFAASAIGPARKVVCAADVTIVAGVNYLRAYAFNRDNVKSDDAVLIIQGAEKLARDDATLYILAVGVNRYEDPAHDLRYAVADAEAVSERLAAQQPLTKQYARAVTVRLLDGGATKENILLALRRLSAGDDAPPAEGAPAGLRKLARMRPEDALLIYFAGHGESDGDRFYLIPHDGFPRGPQGDGDDGRNQLRRRSISDKELEAALESVDAGRMLMVIDSCDSGQALESEEKRRGPMNSRGMAQLAYEKGFYVLTAAQSRQAALEASKLGHGLLTFALLEGIEKADADGNGLVTVREWFDYAAEQVPLLQLEAMRRRSEENSHAPVPSRRSEIVFGVGSDANLPPNRRGLQVPRSFYRAETEGSSFVVSAPRPASN